MPLCVFTLMGESLVVDQVYRLCFVTIKGFDTKDNILN